VTVHIDSDTASVGVAIEDSASDTDVEVKHQARRGVLAPPGRFRRRPSLSSILSRMIHPSGKRMNCLGL
jgi:hypothetical protein